MKTFLLRRLIILLPLLVLISFTAFVIIELPPGSYLDTYISNLRQQGHDVSRAQIESLERRYGLDKPFHIRYFTWFSNFLRGDMGYSMTQNKPVNMVVRERIGFSIMIAIVTILFEFIVAVPIGIYSSIKKHSFADHSLTFLGFLGLSIPNFMLALILMYVFYSFFGMNVTGLVSRDLLGEPWNLTKILDALSNIWVVVIVVGTAGTAGLIRVLRGQMLDELNKEYIQAARSKGLSEMMVVLKHALKVAINPLISTIGWLLPRIISGSVIASIVLGIPALGPAMLNSLLEQDMYLAGSILFIQAIMVVIGTIISDVLLAMIDPRIRYD